jgi:hypothetical protein
MTISKKARVYYMSFILLVLAAEVVVVNAAIHFEKVLPIFLFGPLVLFVSFLIYIHQVTGIRCPTCRNVYGVGLDVRASPSVPDKCRSCGSNLERLEIESDKYV